MGKLAEHASLSPYDEPESDDEVIEEIMQDALKCAKIARERLEREEFLQVCVYKVYYLYMYVL